MLYLDTSLIVTAYTREPETRRILDWIRSVHHNGPVVSEWVKTEFASALSIRLRSLAMDSNERELAERGFDRELRDVFSLVAFQDRCFSRAREWVANEKSGLRSSDALHLAIAEVHGAVLCTRDRRFAEGARMLGLQAELI